MRIGKATVEGTPVPGNRVTGDEMFAGNLYTAVYQKTQVYKVVYHFPDMDGAGPETWKAPMRLNLPQTIRRHSSKRSRPSSPRRTKAAIWYTTKTATSLWRRFEVEATVVGGEQTASMEGFLAQKDAQGQVKELFKEWEWKKSDTETLGLGCVLQSFHCREHDECGRDGDAPVSGDASPERT